MLLDIVGFCSGCDSDWGLGGGEGLTSGIAVGLGAAVVAHGVSVLKHPET